MAAIGSAESAVRTISTTTANTKRKQQTEGGDMSMIHRNRIRVASVAALTLAMSLAGMGTAHSAYPEKPIRIIVPLTPGGLADSFTREISQQLSTRLGQPVVIENKPGGSQAIAGDTVAKAAPDGYTLLLGTTSGLVLHPIAKKNELTFDPVRSFTPISMLYSTPIFLVVHPSVKAQSVQELVALAKAEPNKFTYASLGAGTSAHLAGSLFAKMADIKLRHIPYKGNSPATVDLLAGRVHMMFQGGVSAFPYVRDGKLRVLASTGTKRSKSPAPGLPAMNEIYPGFNRVSWFGLFAPAGTPRPIVDRLNKELNAILANRAIHEKYGEDGVDVGASTPEELGKQLHDDLENFQKDMKEAGLI
jgi:tripartite-type tricarboxylate transporter receptor subunit TctC